MNLVSPPALSLARAVEAVLAGAEQAAGWAGILAAFWEAEVGREIQLGLDAPYMVVGLSASPMGVGHLRKIQRRGMAAEGRCCCLWAADAFAVAHRRKVARWYSMAEAIQEWTISCGMLESFTAAPWTYRQRRRSIYRMLLLVIPHPPSSWVRSRPRHRRRACICRGV